MDLRMCRHGVPHEFGSCEYCEEVKALTAERDTLAAEVGTLKSELTLSRQQCREAVFANEASISQLATERERGRIEGIRECIDEVSGCWNLGSAVSALQALACALPTKEEK